VGIRTFLVLKLILTISRIRQNNCLFILNFCLLDGSLGTGGKTTVCGTDYTVCYCCLTFAPVDGSTVINPFFFHLCLLSPFLHFTGESPLSPSRTFPAHPSPDSSQASFQFEVENSQPVSRNSCCGSLWNGFYNSVNAVKWIEICLHF